MQKQFRKAIVCPPAETFAEGLTTVSLGMPSLDRALEQHRLYCGALMNAGLEIIFLTPDEEHPDSTFVRPGASSRLGEVARMTEALSSHSTS